MHHFEFEPVTNINDNSLGNQLNRDINGHDANSESIFIMLCFRTLVQYPTPTSRPLSTTTRWQQRPHLMGQIIGKLHLALIYLFFQQNSLNSCPPET